MMDFHCLCEQIKGLQDWVLHYKETFEWAPNGYMINNECIPNFCILIGNRLYHPAKWIKLNNNGTTLEYTNTNGPTSQPHIINLYAYSNNKFNNNTKALSALPILA